MKKRRLFSLLIVFLSCLLLAQAPSKSASATSIALNDGWNLQSSAKVTEGGDVISTAKYVPKGWYTVSVPTTVVAAMVKQKVYPDPGFGMNLRSYPGMDRRQFFEYPDAAGQPFCRGVVVPERH
jgi:exo-1,4-beta-D-glucosaminidase